MRFQSTFWLLLASLAAICQAADLMQYASQLPACGLTCILGQLPESACKVATNSTCICTDTDFYYSVQACVLSSCTVEQSLSISRLQDTACDRSYRSRRNDLWGFIAVEVVALVCIIMHFVARHDSGRDYGVDDYIMFVVLVLYIPFTVVGQYARLTAFGVDIWTESTSTVTTALKLFFIDESFYLALLALCKLVMLCFFLRIFPNRWFRITVYIAIGFVTSAGIVMVFLQIFQCVPLDYNWEGWMGTYGSHKCLNVNALTYTAASISIFQDVCLLLLPLPLTLTLHTSRRNKLNIVVMFSLGFFILLTSCIRLRYIVLFARTVNPTWDYTDTLIWTALEVNVSIIVISLPAIRVYLSKYLPKVFGSTVASGSESASHPHSRSHGSTSTKQRLHNSRQRGSSNKFSSVFSITTTRRRGAANGVDGDSDTESQLELGDRGQGMMDTEIVADHHGCHAEDDLSSYSDGSSHGGINVRKTTVWTRESGKKPGRM